MENADKEYIKGAIEALLFIGEKTVALEQIQEALETVSAGDIKAVIQELQQEYETQKRGMMIAEIAGGYQMLSSPNYVSYIRNFFKTKVKEKLSRPALETLAIVAYKEPVSRGDIELIRGVNSDGVVVHLLDKGLIKIVGRKEIPGRPYLYGTSKEFLEYFGLKSLKDLPKLEDFPALPTVEENQVKVIQADGNQRIKVESVNIEGKAAVQETLAEVAGERGEPAAESPEETAQIATEAETAAAPQGLSTESPLPNDVRNLKEAMDEINEERSA